MNLSPVPRLSFTEGIYKKPHSNFSLISASRIRISLDAIQTLGNPVCVASLSKSAPGVYILCETMNHVTTVQDQGQSELDRNTLLLEQIEASEKQKAELCASGAKCVTAEELESAAGLADWLKDRLPLGNALVEQWGVLPGTKRMANLWIELLEGEISLEDSRPPKRTVHVASVKIKNKAGKMLVEAYQEMADGSIRERNRPLSEKMKPGENVDAACLRGIYEELGSELGSPERVVLSCGSYRRDVQERVSFSYPGLMGCYILHSMEAIVKHLPDEDFVTEEYESCGCNGAGTRSSSMKTFQEVNSGRAQNAVGVKRHFWKWVSDAT